MLTTLLLLLFTSSAYGGSICNDGWVSPSEGQGACSYHNGIERLCGGHEQISKGVFVPRPRCPSKGYQDDGTEEFTSVFTKALDDRWQLALTQSRMEIEAGQTTPDQLITRAREIMTEQWGSAAERKELADEKAAIARHTKLSDAIAATVGRPHVATWARYIQEPGICTTAEPGLILFKTRGGAIISLSMGKPAAISLEPEAHARYDAVRAVAATNPENPMGEWCPN